MNPILKRVREIITNSGMSQNALERAELGTQAMFSKWMRLDDAEPTAEPLARLVRYFGVNGHWLLTGEGEKHTLASGADAVYQRGYMEGLARAAEALKTLRAEASRPDPDTARERGRRGAEAVKARKGQTPKARGDGAA